MTTNESNHRIKLIHQIRDAYGNVVYTERTQLEQHLYLEKLNKGIKYFQIILSAISTVGFIGAVVNDEVVAVWIGGVFAALLLATNLFFKDFNIMSDMNQHRKTADELWSIKEQYKSLLTDFDSLSESAIIQKRDELQFQTSDVYKNMLKTGKRPFKLAQKALKVNKESFFSDDELNRLLPSHLRLSDTSEENKV